MSLDIIAIKKLISDEFNGDYKKFAKALNLNSITVWRILNAKSNAGQKFLNNLMLFCKNRGHKYEYFFK